MKRILFALLASSLVSSCGLFLQNTGVKNYTPQEKITQPGLNEYQYDFLYLTQLIKEGFPQLDSVFPPAAREVSSARVLSALDTVDNNADFILQVRRYLSQMQNQHTNISLPQEFSAVYPYVAHVSSGTWYLLNLATQYDSLYVGKPIVTLNGQAMSEVGERLRGFTTAENEINQLHAVLNLQLYNKPQYLQAIGVVDAPSDPLTLTLADESILTLTPMATNSGLEVYDIQIKEDAVTRRQPDTYLYSLHPEGNFGYLQWNRCHDQVDILENISSYVKPWLQPVARAYVKSQFRKEKPSERIANFYNPKYPVFRDFLWELVDSLNILGIENLVIDLRNNPGGNLTLGWQLLYFLTDQSTLVGFEEYAYTSEIYATYFPEEYRVLEEQYPQGVPPRVLVRKPDNEQGWEEVTDPESGYFIPENRPVFRGQVYVLADHTTGSAAAMLTTLLQDNGLGMVIGTSVGNNPVGATTYTPMELPKTKAKVSIASTYSIRPNPENGPIQVPDVWVEYTLQNLLEGKDPYLEKVWERIGESEN
ncbi:MAG TPA: hypothetical protein DCE41_21105 [Cytophagales bacterium]|nr:hypothetical protein [Cytophagales bacterium]HAA20785.1 hypothetical protein [Cytophagales bacterium]HAP61760.1 hypothetical protein [Cytophagales bacterium]